MAPLNLPVERKKSVRVTVVMTRSAFDRLVRAAAYAGTSRSELALGVLERGLAEMPAVGDAEIDEAAVRQEDWRTRRGF